MEVHSEDLDLKPPRVEAISRLSRPTPCNKALPDTSTDGTLSTTTLSCISQFLLLGLLGGVFIVQLLLRLLAPLRRHFVRVIVVPVRQECDKERCGSRSGDGRSTGIGNMFLVCRCR